jgi:hypothetical protein
MAAIGAWFLSAVRALFRLQQPLSFQNLIERLTDLAKFVASHPYDLTIGLATANPIETAVSALFCGLIVTSFFLLRRARYRIKELTRYVDAAAIDKALVAEAGLGGRWPRARLTEGGAPWEAVRSEILRPENNILYILGANGADTFGRSGSPLYDCLRQFRHDTRVILVSPKSREVVGRSEAVGMDPEDYIAAIDASVRRLKELRRQQHAIEARYYDGQPNWKLIITSRTVWMQYYMPNGLHVDATPCWRFDLTTTNDGLYHYFSMEFNRVWRRCESSQVDLNGATAGRRR